MSNSPVEACQNPTSPHLERGVSIGVIYLLKQFFFGLANCHCQKPQGGARSRCQIPSKCVCVWGGGGGEVGLDIDRRCITEKL